MAGNKNINDSTLQKLTDFTDALNRTYVSVDGGTVDGYMIITELITYILTQVPGGGDMLRSVYDTTSNGIVDNSELINGVLVEDDPAVSANTAKISFTEGSAVTSNTAFRTTPSTIITAGTNLSWDGNTLNATGGGSTAWGAITGTLADQTDLQNALNAKQNTISDSDDISEGITNLFLTTTERSNITTNNSKVSYTDATDVGLNTTHRTSDGKNHSDVVTNNAKVSYSDSGNVVLLTGNQIVVGEKTLSNNLKVNAQAHGGDSLESFSASKTFDCDDGNVFEMDVTASTTIGISNEEAGTYVFRLTIGTATPPVITVGASFGTKLPNGSLDFVYTDNSVNILTLSVWPSGAKDYIISN